MSLVESITKGMSNPDCAYFVGQSLGYSQSGMLITKIAIIYFGIKLLDKIVFKGIPSVYNKFKGKV